MFLIGQYDSPFVRRVAIALRLYGIKYDHKPWSTFGDADQIAPFNPLRRVPTLVLDGGEALIDSIGSIWTATLSVRAMPRPRVVSGATLYEHKPRNARGVGWGTG